MKRDGRQLPWTLVALLLLLAAAKSIADAPSFDGDRQYLFDIRRGPLMAALDQFSQQTQLQIGVSFAEPANREIVVGPVHGTYSAGAALRELLKETPLSFEWRNDRTIRIFRTSIDPPHAEDRVQEVLVTGTRIAGKSGPAPVRVYGRHQLDQYGASSVADLTRYITQQPFSFGEGYLTSGGQYVQLRGLGFDTTLVLINGRRAPPSANSISLNAFDLNTIPITAVERIEVMSDSASAIYGADAIGGVVNIILRDDIDDPEFLLHYGQAAGGAQERRAAFGIGDPEGKFRSSLVLDYYEQDLLLGAERDLWRNQDYRRYGGLDYRVTTAHPGNVYSLTGQALPGLSSSSAGIPSGTTGVGLSPSDFAGTDGVLNLESSYRYQSIVPKTRRVSAYGALSLDLGTNVTAFGELLFADSEVRAQLAPPSVTREQVPDSNPYNPFGEAVAVDYSFAELGPTTVKTEPGLLRLVGGARGKFSDWSWEVAALRSKEEAPNTRFGDIDSDQVQAAARATSTEAALNFFSSGAAGSTALLSSLVAEPEWHQYMSTMSQASGFIAGPVASVMGRDVELVVGAEWRREEAEFFESYAVQQRREATSTFTEIELPLWKRMSLKLALRRDEYQSMDDAVNPQYGFTWEPADGWLVRAAYSSSFRPPSLFELYMPRTAQAFALADPARDGEVSNIDLIVGGNPDLEVVTARSFTAGLVFTPPSLRDLSIGSSYWRVVMNDRIVVPGYLDVLYGGDRFASRVTRLDPNAEDLALGRLGALQSIDISRLNFGAVETSGIDLDTSYVWRQPSGAIEAKLTATWVHEYRDEGTSSTLPIDRVGIATYLGTIPEWRVVSSLGWMTSRYGASLTATYTSSTQDVGLNGPIDRRLPSQTLVDLQGWLELGASFKGVLPLQASRISIGVLNLFDEAPAFANAGYNSGFDTSQGDLKQRFAYLRFTKQF